MCWIGAPIETLIGTLQHLDENGKGLYDAVVDSDLNPFLVCKKRLTKLVMDGAGGDLGPVFQCLIPADRKLMMVYLRTMGLDMGGQARAPQ